MHISRLGLLALGACVAAFQDTSPFMFFSTSEILFSSPQITTSSSLTDLLSSKFSNCPGSNVYVVAHQPGVSAADFKSGATPYLKRWVNGEPESGIRSSLSVSDVLGEIKPAELVQLLEKSCGAAAMHVDASTGLFDVVDDARPQVIKIDFQPLPEKDRDMALRENDLFLSNLLRVLPSQNYTVFYTTSPSSQSTAHVEEAISYEMDQSGSPLAHQELKRDTAAYKRQNSGGQDEGVTLVDGPLFERYQFFTPGIFMGLIAMLVLISILYVALSAISSLQVSYAAFDKENGPAAQKSKAQ